MLSASPTGMGQNEWTLLCQMRDGKWTTAPWVTPVTAEWSLSFFIHDVRFGRINSSAKNDSIFGSYHSFLRDVRTIGGVLQILDDWSEIRSAHVASLGRLGSVHPSNTCSTALWWLPFRRPSALEPPRRDLVGALAPVFLRTCCAATIFGRCCDWPRSRGGKRLSLSRNVRSILRRPVKKLRTCCAWPQGRRGRVSYR